jgi:hypothetical protein
LAPFFAGNSWRTAEISAALRRNEHAEHRNDGQQRACADQEVAVAGLEGSWHPISSNDEHVVKFVRGGRLSSVPGQLKAARDRRQRLALRGVARNQAQIFAVRAGAFRAPHAQFFQTIDAGPVSQANRLAMIAGLLRLRRAAAEIEPGAARFRIADSGASGAALAIGHETRIGATRSRSSASSRAAIRIRKKGGETSGIRGKRIRRKSQFSSCTTAAKRNIEPLLYLALQTIDQLFLRMEFGRARISSSLRREARSVADARLARKTPPRPRNAARRACIAGTCTRRGVAIIFDGAECGVQPGVGDSQRCPAFFDPPRRAEDSRRSLAASRWAAFPGAPVPTSDPARPGTSPSRQAHSLARKPAEHRASRRETVSCGARRLRRYPGITAGTASGATPAAIPDPKRSSINCKS